MTSNEEATRILEQQQYWLNTQSSAQMSKSLGVQSSGSMGQQSNYLEDYPAPGQSSGSMSQPAPSTQLAIQAQPTEPRAKRRSTSSHPRLALTYSADPEVAGSENIKNREQFTVSGWGRLGIPTLEKQLEYYGVSKTEVGELHSKPKL